MTSNWLESNATAQLWTLHTSNEIQLWYHIYNTTDENNNQAPANIAYGQWDEGSPVPSTLSSIFSYLTSPPRHLHRPRNRPPEFLPHLRPRSPRLPVTKLQRRSHPTPNSRSLGRRLLGRCRRQRNQQHRHGYDGQHARCCGTTDWNRYRCEYERNVSVRVQSAEWQ